LKKLFASVLTLAFTAGSAGLAPAQPSTPAPAEKKAEKPTETKKMPVKSANGAVKAASADSVVVAGKDKQKKEIEWTFAVDPKTSIRKGGKSIATTDLKPGDAVHVRYMDMDGKAMAQSITVRGGGMAKKEAKTEKK
jgi:hypothetical protein